MVIRGGLQNFAGRPACRQPARTRSPADDSFLLHYRRAPRDGFALIVILLGSIASMLSQVAVSSTPQKRGARPRRVKDGFSSTPPQLA